MGLQLFSGVSAEGKRWPEEFSCRWPMTLLMDGGLPNVGLKHDNSLECREILLALVDNEVKDLGT